MPCPFPLTTQVVVRLPDGARRARRFSKAAPLQAVFDFVDVSSASGGGGTSSGGGTGGGSAGGSRPEGGDAQEGGRLAPGSYRLVCQFPRRKYEEGQGGSLEDAGLTSDTALFVELM
jgi:hypothetical protein